MKTSLLRLVFSLAGALLASAQLSARIVNLSTRGTIGADQRRLIAGFVVAGDTPKTVLVRGVGPGLAAFGVTDAASAVKIELFDYSGRLLASNDGFRTTDDLDNLTPIFAQVGAFPLSDPGDSALVATILPGSYTAVVTARGEGDVLGTALAEVYDADAPDAIGSQLVNVSSRGMVGSGDHVLINGFVVSGDGPQPVLIRGIGHDLAQWGLTATAGAVGLRIYNPIGEVVAVTERFNAESEMTDVADEVGAFSMTDASGSLGLIWLEPGAYTVVVDSDPHNADTDICLVEIYNPAADAVPSAAKARRQN